MRYLSMMTFLGGGGKVLPEIVISFRPIDCGGFGGISRITIGSGVSGLAGSWRIIRGGAGLVPLFASCRMIISPGGGGVGGFKYRMASSCM